MKNKAIEYIALLLGLIVSAIGVLTLPGVDTLAPEKYRPYLLAAVALLVTGKNAAYILLDLFDNGKLDKSYVMRAGAAIAFGALLCFGVGCAGVDPKTGAKTYGGLSKDQLLDLTRGVATDVLRVAVPSTIARYGEIKSAKAAMDVSPSAKAPESVAPSGVPAGLPY